MKGVHLGSYWMGENDVVFTMADDFEHYAGVKKIDVGIYYTTEDGKVRAHKETDAYKTVAWVGNAPRRLIKTNYLLKVLEKNTPDFIIVNSAGLYFSDEDFLMLKAKGIKTVCITLSDPDVFDENAKVYGEKFDLCFTNSKKSLLTQYSKLNGSGGKCLLLPFATSSRIHFPEPDVQKDFDVVVVGHARKDRKPFVKALQKKFKVGLYGQGWDGGEGVVNGSDQRRAINRGRIYLSFAKTMAGHTNVKVGLFEAMACKTVVMTDYMDEVFDYFTSGTEIIVFNDKKSLVSAVETVLESPERQKWIAENAYKRFIKDHTWKARIDFILDKIRAL